MANEDIKMLRKAILDYMTWVKSVEAQKGGVSSIRYSQILMDFLFFAIDHELNWQQMFTPQTLADFQSFSGFKGASRALITFSGYLFTQGKIDQPIKIPKPKPPLPEIYEDYLRYHQHSLQVSASHLRGVRMVLNLFDVYLKKLHIELSHLNIEHLDAFMAEFKVIDSTRSTYGYHLRGFLKYLYHERGIISKDLAPLLVGPKWVEKAKPPKFLRPHELKKLFGTLHLNTPVDIRNYAMFHLAYFLGLRPIEISRMTLDDLSFSKRELILSKRKADNPITLPVPLNVLKAISAYVLKARPKTANRHLFLSFHFPYRPISSATVIGYLRNIMKQAGLSSSSYWLRHTYAQSRVVVGRSVDEGNVMLGHDSIERTQVYGQRHTQLVR